MSIYKHAQNTPDNISHNEYSIDDRNFRKYKNGTQELFRYHSFKTVERGRLVISFSHIETFEIIDAFFNVDLSRQRGEGNYKVGSKGQFYPPIRGKFRQFWMQTLKEPPRRWSTVHKELQPKLRHFVFVGRIKTSTIDNGKKYKHLVDIHATDSRPNFLNKETERRQYI